MSVASPWRRATRLVAASAAWKRSPEVPEPSTVSDRYATASTAVAQRRRPGRGARRCPAARLPSLVDARSQGRRRLDLGRGALGERDRALLLGQPVGKLRRRRDSRLECGTTIRCERPVRERRQLGDLLIAVLVFSTASHRHGNTNGNSERAPTASGGARWKAGSRRVRRSHGKKDLAAPARTPSEPLQGRGESTGMAQNNRTV